MSRILALLVCACTVAAMLLPTASAAAPAEARAIDSLNDFRRAHGLRPLHASRGLNRSSSRYARRMIRRDFFGHAALAGGGETIAWHSGWRPRARATIGRWMASPGHRAVLLSGSYRRVGIGMARGRLGSRMATVWVARVGGR
ncbi:MAG: CAP domain-containing protein [Thermoleophilaceae bacterium]